MTNLEIKCNKRLRIAKYQVLLYYTLLLKTIAYFFRLLFHNYYVSNKMKSKEVNNCVVLLIQSDDSRESGLIKFYSKHFSYLQRKPLFDSLVLFARFFCAQL